MTQYSTSIWKNSAVRFGAQDDSKANPGGGANPESLFQSDEKTNAQPTVRIKRSKPKVDVNLLLGDRGLGVIHREFKKAKFSLEEGSERRDMRTLLNLYKEWGFQMYQVMDFPSLMEKIQKFSGSNQIQSYINNRKDYLDSGEKDPEDEVPLSKPKWEEKKAEVGPPAPAGGCLPKNSDLFDQMMNPSQPPLHNMDELNEMDELWNEMRDEPSAPSYAAAPKPQLTAEKEEMRKKVAAKRLAAIARREQRRKEREALAAAEAASAAAEAASAAMF